MGRIDIDVCKNIVKLLLDRGANPNSTDRVRINMYLLVQARQNRPNYPIRVQGCHTPQSSGSR
jgi:ankyrin repeat protein